MVVIGSTIVMMMISTMMMINAPSSKRSVTTPFQGVDASSNLAGVTKALDSVLRGNEVSGANRAGKQVL